MRRLLTTSFVAMFAVSGCLTEPLPSIWDVVDWSMYVQGVDVKDMDEVHFVIEQVDLHYAGEDGEYEGNEYVFSQEMDLDLAVQDATGRMAAFGGEVQVPVGEYSAIVVHIGAVYGVQDGAQVPIEVDDMRFEWDQSFTVAGGEEDELRVVFDIKGKVKEKDGDYSMKGDVKRVLFTEVLDDESGAEVHEVGELVDLPEAA